MGHEVVAYQQYAVLRIPKDTTAKKNLLVNNYTPIWFCKRCLFDKIPIFSNTSFDVIGNTFLDLFFPDSIECDLCPVVESLNSSRHVEHFTREFVSPEGDQS